MTSVDRELIDGVKMDLEARSEGVHVSIVETFDGHHAIYSRVHDRTWFCSNQKVGTIANAAVEQAADEVDEDELKTAIHEFASELAKKQDKVAKQLRPPSVKRLLDETKAVEVYHGETTTVKVTLQHNGRAGAIKFSSGEWVTGSPGPLKEKYHNQFFETLDVETDHWEDLTDAWEEQQEIVHHEEQTTADHVAEAVANGLSRRVEVHADRDKLGLDAYTGWIDYDNGSGTEGVPPDADVIWVPSLGVQEQLAEETSKGPNYMSELSKAFDQNGYVYCGSKNKNNTRVYGFKPDALNVDPDEDVFDEDDDPDPSSEVEP